MFALDDATKNRSNPIYVVAPKKAKATIATAGVVGIFATALFAMKVHLKMSMIATVAFLMIMQQQIIAILLSCITQESQAM